MNAEQRLLYTALEKEFINIKEKLRYIQILENEVVAEDKIKREILMSITLIKGYLVELQNASLLKDSTYFNAISSLEEQILQKLKQQEILNTIDTFIQGFDNVFLELNSFLPVSLSQREQHFFELEKSFVDKTQGLFSQYYFQKLESEKGKKEAILEISEIILPFLRNFKEEVETYCLNFSVNKKIEKHLLKAIEEVGREIYFDSERELLLDKQQAYFLKMKEIYTLLQKLK